MIRTLSPIVGLVVVGGVCWVALGRRDGPADLTYVNPSGIHTLDPARMSWTSDFRVALNAWEGLTTWDPQTMVPIGGAALFPPTVSKDGLRYTFTIRDDARWSNGDPVTSGDFVRGWRRGMEPGTATDYTFLFTDNVVGAGDYVRWRREAVSVLVPASRLAAGWKIDADQAKSLATQASFQQVAPQLPNSMLRPIDGDDSQAWSAFADGLATAPVDWRSLHSDVLHAHAAEMDERFAAIGVTAPSDHTLVVELVAPCPYFLDLTAMPIFLPIHESIELLRQRENGLPITAQGLVAYDPQWTKPDYHADGYPGLITNGAYRIADWTFKRRLRLAVNPFYHAAARVTCRSVDMVVHESISASIMAYERGDVDFLPSMVVPYDHEIARLARTGARPDFHLCSVLATYFLNFNCTTETVGGKLNPFRDPRVRRAFALAIDRRQIVEKVLSRGDRVARSFVPPDTIAGYEPPAGLSHDPAAARRLLGEAGFPNGAGLPPIDVLYPPRESRTMEAMAHMWEETLGVRVELRGKESRTFAEDKAHQRFMIASGNWYADYNDPTTFLNCLQIGNGNNDSGYANPAYDELLARANRQRDAKRRSELLREAEAVIVEQDLPIMPILFYREPIAIAPNVHGLYANARMWFPFRHVTVTP